MERNDYNPTVLIRKWGGGRSSFISRWFMTWETSNSWCLELRLP